MTQEEKQLLLKDLCARLPYGVICSSNKYKNVMFNSSLLEDIEKYEIKPYLRPMSSMTEEEEWKYNYIKENHTNWEAYDYLNSIHIDYRGLISMNLALEAPKDMYKEE